MNEARRIRLEDDTNEKKKKRKEDYLLRATSLLGQAGGIFFGGRESFNKAQSVILEIWHTIEMYKKKKFEEK